MLPKATVAFLALALTAAIVACTNLGQTTGVNVGPNFPSKTVYASNSNQNAISIYNPGSKNGSSPSFEIGGGNTTLNGPQYLAFDRRGNLWVTNYNPSTNRALLIEFEALATGNVLPLISTGLAGRPRGIAFTPKMPTSPGPAATTSASPSPPASIMAIASVIANQTFPARILLFTAGATSPYQSIGGPRPHLRVPSGVAIDPQAHLYVTNLQGKSVEEFVLPTPSPTPKPTPTPSSTPSPSPTPNGSPSPSPSPSPTPSPINIFPVATLGPQNGIITPAGIALDQSGNIYIADQGVPNASCSSPAAPAILVFAPFRAKMHKPIHKIQGCNTHLLAPTDVKVDSGGMIYVADSTATGSGVIYLFLAGQFGNVAPNMFKSPGTVTGLGILP
jgi:hypothetical protein